MKAEAWGHIAYAVKKQREIDAHTQLDSHFSLSPEPSPMKWHCPHLEGLPSSVEPFWKLSHRHTIASSSRWFQILLSWQSRLTNTPTTILKWFLCLVDYFIMATENPGIPLMCKEGNCAIYECSILVCDMAILPFPLIIPLISPSRYSTAGQFSSQVFYPGISCSRQHLVVLASNDYVDLLFSILMLIQPLSVCVCLIDGQRLD